MVGPGIGSAMPKASTRSDLQKYGALKSSLRQITCAPRRCASLMRCDGAREVRLAISAGGVLDESDGERWSCHAEEAYQLRAFRKDGAQLKRLCSDARRKLDRLIRREGRTQRWSERHLANPERAARPSLDRARSCSWAYDQSRGLTEP